MKPLPRDEVEWIAATAFNEAVDWFGGGEEERAREWADRAINLAHYCNDEGSLEAILQEKYLLLQLEEKE